MERTVRYPLLAAMFLLAITTALVYAFLTVNLYGVDPDIALAGILVTFLGSVSSIILTIKRYKKRTVSESTE